MSTLIRSLSTFRIPLVVALLASVAPRNARGQPVIAPRVETSSVGSSAPAAVSGSGSSGDFNASGGSGLPASPLEVGPFQLRPHFDFHYLHGSGIQSHPGQASSTSINTLSPGLMTELGTHWSLDYTPSWNYYSNPLFRDSVDQSLLLSGRTSYEAWTFAFNQNYARNTAPLAETATQTTESDYVTSLDMTYQFASQLALQTVLSQSLRFAEGFTTTREWSDLEYLHLSVASDLDSAAGLKFGYLKQQPGTNFSYIQILGRVAAHPSKVLTFTLQGGLERRKALGTQGGSTTNPVLSAAADYRPTASTGFSVTADRSESGSYFSNQTIRSSRISVGLEQDIIARLHLSASTGYQQSEFRAAINGLPGQRRDKNYFYSLGLGLNVLHRITVALSYLYNNNSSDQQGFSFTSNQVSLHIGYRY